MAERWLVTLGPRVHPDHPGRADQAPDPAAPVAAPLMAGAPVNPRPIIRYPEDSAEFALQTAVMMALPPAMHAYNDNWRSRADVLIEQLSRQGYRLVPTGPALSPALSDDELDEWEHSRCGTGMAGLGLGEQRRLIAALRVARAELHLHQQLPAGGGS